MSWQGGAIELGRVVRESEECWTTATLEPLLRLLLLLTMFIADPGE